jgi:hypothetical protein
MRFAATQEIDMVQAQTLDKATGATISPSSTSSSTLRAKLDATRSGLVNAIAGKDPIAAGRVAVMFGKDSLNAEKVALTPALSAATAKLASLFAATLPS